MEHLEIIMGSEETRTATDPVTKTPPATRPDPLRGKLVVFFVAACLVPLIYALVCRHVWEDFFITFRHSQNLCEGHGLVYNPGERVHGFTSPLGTLLPALCYLLTGKGSYLSALWLFRIPCILAFAGGGVLLLRALWAVDPRNGPNWLFLALLYLFEVKAIEFTTDGMETAFMLLFLAWAVYLIMADQSDRWLAAGLCWAGLMWTRPDGCVYILILCLADLIFGRGFRGRTLLSFVRSAAVCATLYLPWFLWAWSYYGSPIPHTIIAKSDVTEGAAGQLAQLLANPLERYFGAATYVFQPIYYTSDPPFWVGGVKGLQWIQWLIGPAALYLAIFCSFYWLLPVKDRLGRMASFCFTLTCVYLAGMIYTFPWYMPPALMFGLVALTRCAFTLAGTARGWFPTDPLYQGGRAVAVGVLLLLGFRQGLLFGFTSWQMKIQAREIELGHRTQIGLWLKGQVRPGESIFLEPFGYVGYFSGARIIDWPGLISPEVVRLRREKCAGFDVINDLRPHWLVLRPSEVEGLIPLGFFGSDYALVTVFDRKERLSQYKYVPGEGWFNVDVTFQVFRRVASEPGAPAYHEVPLPLTPSAVNEMT